MSRTVYLHIGMPKCATTTIQEFLEHNTDALRAAGIHYGSHPGDTTEGQGNCAVLTSELFAGHYDRAEALLDHLLGSEGDVILSSELFLGLARSYLAEKLIDSLRRRGLDVRVICYVRRQDLWIESDFKQHIKGGSPWVETIEALIDYRSEKKVLNYTWALKNWARHVGTENVIVEPLVPGRPGDDAVRRFLTHVGAVDLARGPVTVTSRNVSPATGLMEPARFLKRAWLWQGLSLEEATLRIDEFFEVAPQVIEVPRRKFLLRRRKRALLVRRHAPLNKGLATEFLNGEAPFDNVVQEDAASELDLSQEAGDLVAQYLLSVESPRRRASLLQSGRLQRGLRRMSRHLPGGD